MLRALWNPVAAYLGIGTVSAADPVAPAFLGDPVATDLGVCPGLAATSPKLDHPLFRPVAGGSQVDRFRIATELGSGTPEASSLYEFLASHLHDAALLKEPHTLQDLADLISKSGRARAYELSCGKPIPDSAEEVVTRFLETIDLRRRDGAVPGIVGRPAYALGDRFIRESFAEVLERSPYRDAIRLAILQAPRRPLPFLLLHRLYHLILSHDFEFKVLELLHLPWGRGPLHPLVSTGFIGHPDVARALLRANEAGEKRSEWGTRGRRWMEKSLSLWSGSRRLDARTLADLLEIQPTNVSRELARLLRKGKVDLIVHSRESMNTFVQNRLRESSLTLHYVVEATYLLAQENGGRPGIVILAPEVNLGGDRLAAELLDRAANATHEFAHLIQTEREEALWPVREILLAEMESHAEETLFRLQNGDDSTCQIATALSPYGFAMGLRNWIEQVYLRQRDLPF